MATRKSTRDTASGAPAKARTPAQRTGAPEPSAETPAPRRRRREPMSRVDTAWLRMERSTNLMMITSVMMFESPLALDRLKKIIKDRNNI